MNRDRILNALLFLGGALISLLWVLVLIRSLSETSAPFGRLESSDPILAGPYGPGAVDRFTSNELHVLNGHLVELLKLLEEMKGRLGE